MHYNLLVRGIQAEVIPACQAHGLGVIPYFPLESGFLTGKYGPTAKASGRLAESARAGRDPDPGQLPADRAARADSPSNADTRCSIWRSDGC